MWPYPLEGFPDFGEDHAVPDRDDRSAEIAYAICHRLCADPVTAAEPIGVDVQNGVAILTGVVFRAQARTIAGRHAWAVPGVVDVSNQLIAPDGDDLVWADVP